MKVTETDIPDVKVIYLDMHKDDRGFFMESWRDSWGKQIGLKKSLVQDNFSRSTKGTLRGLHYQVLKPQAKLVRVTTGKVYDVAVDLRKGSPTFGRWAAEELSAENGKLLYIPEGFAHGFYVQSEFAEYTYKCTDYYCPEGERTLHWDDPDLAVDWPFIDRSELIVSQKDQLGLSLSQCETFQLGV